VLGERRPPQGRATQGDLGTCCVTSAVIGGSIAVPPSCCQRRVDKFNVQLRGGRCLGHPAERSDRAPPCVPARFKQRVAVSEVPWA
jgi:hypothetical protein